MTRLTPESFRKGTFRKYVNHMNNIIHKYVHQIAALHTFVYVKYEHYMITTFCILAKYSPDVVYAFLTSNRFTNVYEHI